MSTVIVLTQNVILDSIEKNKDIIVADEKVIFVTTHYLFENERLYLYSLFENCEFKTFADFLTDNEMSLCDVSAYSNTISKNSYLDGIRKKKNEIVVEKVIAKYKPSNKYILSDDLGIDLGVWKRAGFKKFQLQYYYKEPASIVKTIKNCFKRSKTISCLYSKIKSKPEIIHTPEEVLVGYHNGKKYVYLGKMSRIGYRLEIQFVPSPEDCEYINRGMFEEKDKCTYLTTWHEQWKCNVPDDERYDVRWAQDGYLPPNYSHKDYQFKPDNVKYYCWDHLGTLLFRNQGLPYEMIPFRKKLYLPEPKFPSKVKNVLIVASGSGDWTALKNRSDDDIMVDAFVQMAKRFPNIHFTYRCHPTWVHPSHVGVNSINRVHDYFKWLNLPNLTLSSNIPLSSNIDEFQLSYSRSSLDEDLKNADFVFGEHSISMIDGAFKAIPFASVNITNRRSFFVGITDLGFPCCSTIEEIENMIKNIDTESFRNMFLKAVDNYNKMTDMEI